MPGDRAMWSRRLAKALLSADLSIDAAAYMFGMKRVKMQQLLRSDTAKRPRAVELWLEEIEAGQPIVSDQAMDD